jgi:molybdopterin/thiamine biosynthesis adenylyltransferase
MPGKFHHESLYRGETLLAKLARTRLTLCGAGAIGSNLADTLVRQGASHLRVIDHDRVDEHNVSTQTYGEHEVGVWKVEALRNHLFRVAGVEIDAVRKQLVESNARQLLKDTDLIIDAFDNAASRKLVQDTARASVTPCLHIGLFEDYCEVVWDEAYRVPNDVAATEVCDYPLARNLVLLATALAGETILRFLADGTRVNRTATLRDFVVSEMD